MGEATGKQDAISNWKRGRLHAIDDLPNGDASLGGALTTYADQINTNRNSRHWVRAVQWVENFLFSIGRQYVDDILISRLSRDTAGQQSIVQDAADNIPKPVNDLLGRYIETNIAMLTENKPIPRIEAKSGRAEDEDAAKLSELTMDYMWEALDLPEKHREIARLILHTGVAWIEIIYDETLPRRVTVPDTERADTSVLPGVGGGGISIPVSREVPLHDEDGRPIYTDKVEYGDIRAQIISPFEMHLPTIHWWDGEDMGWIMREYYTSKDILLDKYEHRPGLKLKKRDGWYLDNLPKAGSTNVRNLPIWWWERLADIVEGPGPSLYVGTPETWEDFVTVRVFDRKPNTKWPRGRTIITVGDQILYDSPKKRGARAYDPRWPERWHPYVRFRWEAMAGNIHGRSLVAKLLPKLKRVNAIDTTMIMWRRTVPMSAWVIPKGAQPIEDQWLGRPGQIWEYDPRRTAGAAPEPIYPPPYPAAAMEERQQQIQEMEAIAGTEEILRGQRPTGVNCWVEGSELTNASGVPVNVKDIKEDDTLTTMKGEGYVGACHSRKYSGPVIEIKSYGNLPITVTPNHQLPVWENGKIVKKYAGDLKKRDLVLSGFIRSRNGVEKLDVSKYVAAVAGCGGENHGAVNITNEDVEQIRKRLSLGETGKKLAKEFGCSASAVYRIKHNKTFNGSNKTRLKAIPQYIELNDDMLWLFGIYLAEGFVVCSSTDKQPTEIGWALHESETRIANRILGILSKEFGLNNFKIRKCKDDRKGMYVRGGNRALAKLFMALFGTGSSKKSIHADVFNTPGSLLPMVAGWFDGDGSNGSGKNKNAIRCSTVSKSLAAQMRSILLDEKIPASIGMTKPRISGKFIGRHNQYHVKTNGLGAKRIAKVSIRFNSKDFNKSKTGNYKGVWVTDNFYASYVRSVSSKEYTGKVYNVTMNELKQNSVGRYCDNSVSSLDLLTYQSAAMIDILRKQALAGRSSILQSWDESLQKEGSIILQEVIKNIRNDSRYAERLRVLARGKVSTLAIRSFSGSDLSDNVMVKIDTASMALSSKEAKQAKAIELIQYSGGLANMEPGLKAKVLEEIGYEDTLIPQGADVSRVKRIMAWIRQEAYNMIVPMPEDDPFIFYSMLVDEMKSDGFHNLNEQQQQMLLVLIDLYRKQAEQRQQQMMQQQLALQGGQSGQPPQGGQ